MYMLHNMILDNHMAKRAYTMHGMSYPNSNTEGSDKGPRVQPCINRKTRRNADIFTRYSVRI